MRIKLFKHFDKSSKILILFSLFGILSSIVGLGWTFFNAPEEEDKIERIAKISFSTSDTRLKRSGNMHWYQVTQKINCFKDDLVFTGEDSTATIEFPSGDKIFLLPNSLISVSPQLIVLENGAVEVDLLGEQPFKLETNGKVVKLSNPARFTITQTNKEMKIVPIAGSVPKPEQFKIADSNPLDKKELFETTYPRYGQIIPQFPNSKLFLKWHYDGENQNFVVEIAGKRYQLTKSQIEINRADLSIGKVNWKVSNYLNQTQESYFEITDQYAINLNYPHKSQEISIDDSMRREIEFNWDNPLDLSQRIEISQDPSFSDVQITETTTESSLKVSLPKGNYFWRVGFLENEIIPYWSEVNNFTLSTSAPVTLSFIDVPVLWDFKLKPVLNLTIDSSKGIDQTRFQLTGPINLTGKVENNVISLKELQDGIYKIQLFGYFQNKEISSISYEFEVKNSLPLPPPKIKKSNNRIFVKALIFILDWFVSSAHAEQSNLLQLKWEGDVNTTYEVQIWDERKKRILVEDTTKNTSYEFKIRALGKYHWRVRVKDSSRTGLYSEFSEIEVKDKVEIYNRPLMKFAQITGDEMTFTWHEPNPDFSYFLEIYSEKSQSPFISKRVTGGREAFSPDLSNGKYYWRIKAISNWGNENPNQQKFLLQKPGKEDQAQQKNIGVIILRAAYLFNSYNYSQEISGNISQDFDQDRSMSGPTLQLRGELWPNRFNRKYAIQLGLRHRSVSSGNKQISDSEFLTELGYAIKQESNQYHHIFAGVNFNSNKFDTTEIDGHSIMTQATLRYQYNRNINQKFSLTTDTLILQELQSEFNIPSLRVTQMFNWHFKSDCFFSPVISYEKNQFTSQYNHQVQDGDLKISNSIMSFGFMINWNKM